MRSSARSGSTDLFSKAVMRSSGKCSGGLSHLRIYFTHPTVWLTEAEICKETQVFPKLNVLANNNRLVLDLEIIIPPVDKLGTVSTCRGKQ